MMSKEIHSAADFEKEITNHKGYALVAVSYTHLTLPTKRIV